MLVHGDRALAEPLGARLAAEIAALWGVEARREIHPTEFADLAQDLRTVSLFEPGKLVVALESGLLADRSAAAVLVKSIEEKGGLNFVGGADDLVGSAREAALLVLQLLRLHDVDPAAGSAESLLAALPDASLVSGRKQAEAADQRRLELAPLLTAAQKSGLRGVGEKDLALLSDLLRDGLPERHLLILVESSVAEGHPFLGALQRRRAVLSAGSVAARGRGQYDGLRELVAELARETGTPIADAAMRQLADRTLRLADHRDGGGKGAIEADSAARFAAEYRKLANLTGGERIESALVEGQVEDRGREEVWSIVNALSDGKLEIAIGKTLHRIAAAEDPIGERLALFSLLTGHARLLAAIGGALKLTGAPAGEGSFSRFKARIAGKLQGTLPGVKVNPLAKAHPYRLHRNYLAASRFSLAELSRLPAIALETERRLKGESDDPDAALVVFLVALAGPVSSSRSAKPESRARGASGGRS